jgi:hypothetical protein
MLSTASRPTPASESSYSLTYMTWDIARRLSAASDKYGDEFFEARKTWLMRADTTSHKDCLAAAKLYEAALKEEIGHLEQLEMTDEVARAIKRAKMYERLLVRQLLRIKSHGS